MDVKEIRRIRLQQLLREQFAGEVRLLAESIDKEPNFVTRYVTDSNSRKNMGEKLAREIEQKLGLEMYWLDKAKHRARGKVSEQAAGYIIADTNQIADPALRVKIEKLIKLAISGDIDKKKLEAALLLLKD